MVVHVSFLQIDPLLHDYQFIRRGCLKSKFSCLYVFCVLEHIICPQSTNGLFY
ncbi:hypothetical protein Leryth_010366 [Lithospermum erythrorhizon]|nr:hypothetical protein Leryth_010366 [Lithospermum erythrorhizon]